ARPRTACGERDQLVPRPSHVGGSDRILSLRRMSQCTALPTTAAVQLEFPDASLRPTQPGDACQTRNCATPTSRHGSCATGMSCWSMPPPSSDSSSSISSMTGTLSDGTGPPCLSRPPTGGELAGTWSRIDAEGAWQRRPGVTRALARHAGRGRPGRTAHDKGNAMRGPKNRGRDSDAFITEVNARLSEAAAAGATVELILVVKGRVRPVPGRHRERWRVRTGLGHVVTFRP